MKKVLSLVLALALVLGSFAPAFAAENEYAEAGATLLELGVLTGDGTSLNLDGELTRAELYTLVSRLKGQGETAKNFPIMGSAVFNDVEDHWANPIVGWAFANSLTTGMTVDTFVPDGKVTVQQLQKLMLTVLGYTDVEWDNVPAMADTLGIMGDIEATGNAPRGLMAQVVLNTLKTEKADGTILATDLGYDELVEEEPVVVGDLAVEEITAENLKQLVIEFSEAIDAAGDEDNYVLTADNAVLDANSNFELSADGKTVTITLTTAAQQQDKVDLEIKDILAEDTTIEDIQFLDLDIPQATKAEAAGIDTIEIFFSEPMKTVELETKANYSVEDADEDTLYVKGVTAGTNNMSALVELYADMDSDVQVTVSDVKDYQDFTALSTTLAVDVEIDEEAPAVVSFKDASTTEVTLVFDNNIEVDGYNAALADPDAGVDFTDFYHTNTSDVSNKIELDGNELTITFADEMPVGTAYVYIAEDAINDLWDNDNDKIVVTIEVTVDEDAPAVDGAVDVTGQDTIEITFDEDVVEGDDYTVTLLDEDGEDTEIDSATVITDEVIKVIFDEEIYGHYTVVIEDVEDAAGNEANTISLDFFVDDETNPDGSFSAIIYGAATADQLVVVDFGEEMNIGSITDKGNYFYGTTSLDDEDVTITVIDSGEGVEIEIPSSVIDITAADDITIGRVKDAAGNLMNRLSTLVNVADGDSSTIAIASVELTATDTIVLTVDGDELVDIDATKFDFQAVGSAVDLDIGRVKTGLNSDGETTITFILGTALETDATTDGTTLVNYIVGADAGENVYGQVLATVADGAATVADAVGGSIALDADDNEKITTVDSDGNGRIDHIVVEYDEEVRPATLSLLTYEVDDYTITSVDADVDGDVAVLSGAGKYVVLTVAEITSGTDTDATPNVTQAVDIQDVATNTIEATSAISALDTVIPTYTVAVANGNVDDTIDAGDTITITFSEETDKPVLTQASFAGTGAPNFGDEATFVWSADGTTLTITLGTTGLDVVATDTIAFAAVDTVEDAAGNDVGAGDLYTAVAVDF